MRRLFLLVAALLFTVTLSACGDDDKTGPGSASIAGTYTLRTVDGKSVPYTYVEDGADRYEVLSETLVVAEGGTFTSRTSLRSTVAGVTRTRVLAGDGTYTRAGTALVLNFAADQTTGTGTLVNGTITIAIEGLTLVYRK